MNRKFLFRNIFIFLILFFLAGMSVFAVGKNNDEAIKNTDEKGPVPVIKIPTSVRSIKWNRNDTSFAYSEHSNIFIRNGEDLTVQQQIHDSNEIRVLKYAEYGNNGQMDQLLSYTDDNAISVRQLPNVSPRILQVAQDRRASTAVAFSQDGTFIALGEVGGPVNLYMQLYLSGDISSRKLVAHKGDVYSLVFSNDGKLLVSAATDGTVRIWNTNTGENVISLNQEFVGRLPVIFNADASALILAKDENTLVQRDFKGETINEIEVEEGIRSFVLNVQGNAVIVLNAKNQFQYFDLETGEFVGYVPAFNKSSVSSFDFSHDGTRLLLGHTDGTIYILNVMEVFYLPGETPAIYDMYYTDVGPESGWKYDAALGPENENEFISIKTAHNIVFRAQYKNVTAESFTHGMHYEVGYINDWLIKKVYIGGFFGFEMYFPNESYPYVYTIGRTKLKNPYMIGYTLTLSGGKIWYPFKSKVTNEPSDLGFFVEAYITGALKQIMSPALGSGKINTTFNVGASAGFTWKGFSVYGTGGYDSVLIGSFGAGVSYRIRITPKKKSPAELEYEAKRKAEKEILKADKEADKEKRNKLKLELDEEKRVLNVAVQKDKNNTKMEKEVVKNENALKKAKEDAQKRREKLRRARK